MRKNCQLPVGRKAPRQLHVRATRQSLVYVLVDGPAGYAPISVTHSRIRDGTWVVQDDHEHV